MNVKTEARVEYMIAVISEFAVSHQLTPPQAFRYLKRYKGIEFIDKYYGVNHTLSFDTMVTDLTEYCANNGGKLA